MANSTRDFSGGRSRSSVFQRTKKIPGNLYFLALVQLIPLLMIMLFVGQGFAQSTYGIFVGTVHDPSGSVVAEGKITVTNTGTAAQRATITDKEGNYTVGNLEPGTYDITVQAAGFATLNIKGLELLARETVRADGNLSVAGQAQAVNVNAETEAVITTEVSNLAETKTGAELGDLPVAIASRALGSTSAITTLTTQPGVQIDNAGNISVSGSKPSQLSMTIDGISTMSPRASAPIAELFPSFGAIEEIRVSENTNSAEYSGISDITSVSKSGTNSLHGGVYENLQNTDMDARNPFSTSVTQVKMNDFGGYLGGPVIIPHLYHGKDKTFFFASYEGLRLPRQTFLEESVPSVALRSGNLSVYPGVIMNGSGGVFPNNQIPASMISPIAQNALTYLFPLPNTGAPNAIANNYSVNFPTPISSNQEDVRIDHSITSRQNAFFRVTYKSRSIVNAPATTGTVMTGGLLQPEIDYAFIAGYNFVITPNLVNEIRAGDSGTRILTSSANPIANGVTAAKDIGIPIPQPDNGDETPNFNINGFQPTTSTASSVNRGRTQQIYDNLTWTKGQHTFKFGIDVRKLASYLSNGFASSQEGAYTFNGSVTNSIIGNPFAAFLLGVPDRTQVGISDLGLASCDINGYAIHYEGFAQDDWKITSRFTLNYGIRYEYHPAFYDHLHNVGVFLPDVRSIINGVSVAGEVAIPDAGYYLLNQDFAESIAPTPIVTASQAGIPQNLHFADKTEFAPRIGFAWRVTQDSKTVVRAGFGKFIETEYATLADADGAVPQSYIGTFTNKLVNGVPTYTLSNPFPSNLGVAGTQTFQSNNVINYKDPYVLEWNVTLERDLGFNTGLRVSYEGNHGADLGYAANLAQIPANTIGYAASVAAGASPFPLWASLNTEFNGARSNYDALTIEAHKRMSHGLQFSTAYTWAKNLSNQGGYNPTAFASEGGGEVTDKYNINLDYGNVAFTPRSRLLSTFLYQLPFGQKQALLSNANKFVNGVIGGWQVSGVYLAQTGPFLTVLATADPEGDGFPTLQGNGRADSVSRVSVVPANQSIYNWINKAAFAVPPNNVGRGPTSPVGSVVGPGTQALSMSLFKSFVVREGVHFQIGAAASNALNHPNYSTPSLTLGTASFGTISNVQTQQGAGPRAIQATARVTF